MRYFTFAGAIILTKRQESKRFDPHSFSCHNYLTRNDSISRAISWFPVSVPLDTRDDVKLHSADDSLHPLELQAPVAAEKKPAIRTLKTKAAPSSKPAIAKLSPKFIMLLGMMCALGAVTTDMYLPSLPVVASDLNASESSVQFTITATLLGGALGQLIMGPLSDRFGRRKPVFVGVAIHIIASVICIFTYNVVPLIALRIIQGIGNASAGVVAMAVIRDRLTGSAASAAISRLMLVIGIAPLLAPTIGATLAGWWGWRSTFGALAIFGALLMFAVWRFLPETLPADRRLTSTKAVLTSYPVLLKDRTYMLFAIMPGAVMTILFAYVAGAPFIFQQGFGLSETQFALLFAVNGIGLVAGAQVNAALVRRYAPIRILRLILPLTFLTIIWLFIVTLYGGGLFALLVPLFIAMTLNALAAPNASAIALTRHGDRAGAAAALIGALQSFIPGVVAPLVGIIGGDAKAMAIVMLGSMTAGMLILVATGAYRRGGWEIPVSDLPDPVVLPTGIPGEPDVEEQSVAQ